LLSQELHLGDRKTGIVSDDNGVRGLEDPVEFRYQLLLCRSIHCELSPVGGAITKDVRRLLRQPSVVAQHARQGRRSLALPSDAACRIRSKGSNRSRAAEATKNRPDPSVQALQLSREYRRLQSWTGR